MSELIIKAAVALGLWSQEPKTPKRPGTPRPTTEAKMWANKIEHSDDEYEPESPTPISKHSSKKLLRTFSFDMDRTVMNCKRTPYGEPCVREEE